MPQLTRQPTQALLCVEIRLMEPHCEAPRCVSAAVSLGARAAGRPARALRLTPLRVPPQAAAYQGVGARLPGGNAPAPTAPRAPAFDTVMLASDDDDDGMDVPLGHRLAARAQGDAPAERQARARAAALASARSLLADDSDDDDAWGAAPSRAAPAYGGAGGGAAGAASDSDPAFELPQRFGGGFGAAAGGLSDDDDDFEVPLAAPKRKSGGKGAAKPAPGTKAAEKAAEKEHRAEERRQAAASKKAAKEDQKAANKTAREEHRAATGKLANQQITCILDTRLAATAAGRALGAALEAAKFAHTVATLPIEGSACWVRHAARATPWTGALPWPGAAAAAAAAREGATPVPYVMVVFEAARLTAAVEAHGGLEAVVASARAAHPNATLCVCGIGVQQHLRSRERSEFSAANPTAGFSRSGVDAALARLVTHVRGVRQRMARDVNAAAEHGALLTDALARQPYRADESFLSLFGGEKKGGKHASAMPAADPDAAAGGESPQADASGAATNKRSREPTLADAWVAALARVPGSSVDSASAIARAYPSLAALMTAYRAPGMSPAVAKNLLANVMKDVPAGAKARRVGPACSERMWKLFRPRPAGDNGDEELCPGAADT